MTFLLKPKLLFHLLPSSLQASKANWHFEAEKLFSTVPGSVAIVIDRSTAGH